LKSIHIGGVYYGLHNVGDEAILYSMVNNFSKKYKVSVSSYDSSWIHKNFTSVEIRNINLSFDRPKYLICSTPRRKIISNTIKIFKEIEFLKTKNAYICGGATILSDCPWYSLRTVELAGKAHIPVFLWGVGITDDLEEETASYVKKICNKKYVKHIFLRDEFVMQRLMKIGVNANKMTVVYDPAIMIAGSKFTLNEYLDDYQISMYNNNSIKICISISGESDVASRTPINEIQRIILKLIEKYKCKIFLIPTGCGKHCSDKILLKRLCIDDSVTFISNEFSPQHLVEFLKNIDLTISSRLHMNILSAAANTPFIGLVRNSKIVDFSKLFDLPYISLDDMNFKEVVLEVDNILKNSTKIKEKINEKLVFMKSCYEEGNNLINSMV